MCVCRCIKAIVSDSAFSVPPQQLITNDGGIIEIGAEVSTAPRVTCPDITRVACPGAVRHHRRGRHGQGGRRPPGHSEVGCRLERHEKYFYMRMRRNQFFLREINCRSLGKTVLVRLLAKKHVRPQTSKEQSA